jgi:plasmid stabilization system protein ParE
LGAGLRSFPVGNYIVLYQIQGNGDVWILHVVQGNRNIQALLT